MHLKQHCKAIDRIARVDLTFRIANGIIVTWSKKVTTENNDEKGIK